MNPPALVPSRFWPGGPGGKKSQCFQWARYARAYGLGQYGDTAFHGVEALPQPSIFPCASPEARKRCFPKETHCFPLCRGEETEMGGFQAYAMGAWQRKNARA
jgi:hypothetical protein